MATFTPISFTANTKIKSADVNGNFTQIQTILNAGITDANVASGAAILRNKLAAGTVGQIAINAPSTGALSDYGVANTVQANWLPLASQGSDPTTPPSGAVLLYNKNKKLYTINDAGAITQVGAGSNSAINYVLNPDAEVDTTGWVTYSSSVTATITIASPGVVTVASTTGYSVGDPVVFTTTGALPTGLTAGTTYYISAVPSGTTFKVSATLGGADVNTSGTQSGTHTVGVARPLTGLGGTPTATFTRSTSSPLRGTSNFLFTHGNTGDGVAYAFTIDAADQAKVLNISFDYNLSGTITDGDYSVWIYDVGSSARIQPAPYKLSGLSSALNGKFTGTFQTASNSTSYRLCIHQSNASSVNVKMDNVQVGPQIVEYGAPVTDWQSYAPTFTAFGTVTGASCWYRRVGDSVELYGKFTSGTIPAGTPCSVTLPSGLTIDSIKVPSIRNLGVWTRNISDATIVEYTVLGTGGDSLFKVGRRYASGSPLSPENSDGVSASSEVDTFHAIIPIAGWGSSVVMSNDSDTRVVAAAVKGDAPSASAGNPIIFPTVVYDTHAAYNASTGQYTAQVPGFHRVHGYVSTGAANTIIRVYVNGVQGLDIGVTHSNFSGSFDGTVKVNAGDLIDIRPSNTCDVDATSNMYIERVSGASAIASSEAMGARVTGLTTTSAVGTTPTQMVFKTVDFSSHGGYSAGTYTPQSPGKFRIIAQVTGVDDTSGDIVTLSIYKNGVAASSTAHCVAFNASTQSITCEDELNLLAGDLITVFLVTGGHNFTPADSVASRFVIRRLG